MGSRAGYPSGMRHREVERKFDVPVGFILPPLAGSIEDTTVEPPVRHRLTATYFNTEDFNLARHGVTLRRRTGGTDAGWHLKRPAGSAPGVRTEIQAPLGRNRLQVP